MIEVHGKVIDVRRKWHVYRKFHILIEARSPQEALKRASELEMMKWDFMKDEVGDLPEE
jgi:hypothetical protein